MLCRSGTYSTHASMSNMRIPAMAQTAQGNTHCPQEKTCPRALLPVWCAAVNISPEVDLGDNGSAQKDPHLLCCLSCRGKMALYVCVFVCVFVHSQQLWDQLQFSWINDHVSRTQQACRPQDGPCVRTEKWVSWKPAYSPSVVSPPEARILVHYRKNNTRSKNSHESLSKWN